MEHTPLKATGAHLLGHGSCPACQQESIELVQDNYRLRAINAKLLEALKDIQLEASEADESDNPYNVLESIDKVARTAIKEAQK